MTTVQLLIAAGDLSTATIVVRLSLAVLAGTLLGLDRERNEKPAGLRTHMMVSLGSAAVMLVSLGMEDHTTIGESLRIDPLRAVAGIIGGIGFLGAGTIIEARGAVKGITTAASIWVTAAIGIACGAGMYVIATCTLALAAATLLLIGIVEHWLFPKMDD